MTAQKSLKSNIWKFYVITALGIRFIAPIRILYLLSFGLTYAQIGMMELAAAIVIIILEIPTGIFADVVGRKISGLIACVLSIAAFSCLSLGSALPIFIFGWALSGAADAFQSGSQDALIFDSLRKLNRENDYLKIKSHFVFITTISVVIGSLVGAFLYTINPRLPWYLMTVTLIISTIIFATITEPEIIKKHSSLIEQLKNLKLSLWESLSSSQVVKLILFGLILTLPMYVFTTLISQPYLTEKGYSVESLGIVFAVITAASGLIAMFTHKIEPILKQRYSLLLIIVSFSVILVSMGLVNTYVALGLVVVFYIVDSFKNLIVSNYLNQAISSESRATVLSVQSFLNNIAISILFVFIGYLVDIFSINVVLISMGMFVALSCLPLWYISRNSIPIKLSSTLYF